MQSFNLGVMFHEIKGCLRKYDSKRGPIRGGIREYQGPGLTRFLGCCHRGH